MQGAEEFMDMFRRNAGYLYRMAQCYGGTAAEAEQVLENALWNAFRRHGAIRKKGSFRMAVMQEMELNPKGDRWQRMEGLDSPAGMAFSELGTAVKRALVIHYECGWSEKDAAKGCGISLQTLQRAIRQIESLSEGDEFAEALHAALMKSTSPEMGRTVRAFMSRAESWKRPGRWGRRIGKTTFSALVILLLCGLFWLVAVLLEG